MRAIYLLILFLAGSANPAVACVCEDHPPVPDALNEAAAVFTGRVIELKFVTRAEDGRERSVLQCVFDKVDPIKGVNEGIGHTLQIITDRPNVRCGYPFSIGEEYLVYTYSAHGELWTSVCQRTKPLRVFVREPFNLLIPRSVGEPVDDSGQKEAALLRELKTANQALQTTPMTRSEI